MLRFRSLVLSVLFSFGAALVVVGQEVHSPATSSAAFEQLKSLAGDWQGTHNSGASATVSYQVVSGGSAVMERLLSDGEHEMITMYTLDGDRIVVTHYCAAGNQPTMQTAPIVAASGKYDFSFVRVSGTKTPDEGRMVALTVAMPDKEHLTQVWTYLDHGKSLVDTFNYTRKK
jgi:hypothetical protein